MYRVDDYNALKKFFTVILITFIIAVALVVAALIEITAGDFSKQICELFGIPSILAQRFITNGYCIYYLIPLFIISILLIILVSYSRKRNESKIQNASKEGF